MTGCFLCELYPGHAILCRNGSLGIVDRHHAVPQQRIKRQYPRGGWVSSGFLLPVLKDAPASPLDITLERLLADERNLIPLGRWHHMMLTNARVRIMREALPDAVEEFARFVGLQWSLDRDYGELLVPDARAAAAA